MWKKTTYDFDISVVFFSFFFFGVQVLNVRVSVVRIRYTQRHKIYSTLDRTLDARIHIDAYTCHSTAYLLYLSTLEQQYRKSTGKHETVDQFTSHYMQNTHTHTHTPRTHNYIKPIRSVQYMHVIIRCAIAKQENKNQIKTSTSGE